MPMRSKAAFKLDLNVSGVQFVCWFQPGAEERLQTAGPRLSVMVCSSRRAGQMWELVLGT